MTELAALLIIAFAIFFAVCMIIIAAWGIWSNGYNQGYVSGKKEKVAMSGRTIFEPYKESLKVPNE